MGLDDRFRFGQYKGKPLWEVLEKDRRYVVWCIDEIPGFELDDEAWEAFGEEA
jgi:hypothetical protein